MPRPKAAAVTIEHAALNHEVIANDTQLMDADAVRRHEIVERYGDHLPYDRNRVVNEARFYMRQGATAMLEAGKRLVQIKEFEEHGDFEQIVDELGLTPRTAQRLMAAAVKFLMPGHNGTQKLLALDPTKLYDLAILDDDDLKELAKGKTVAGLKLEEIDAMSTRELRAAVREAKKQLDAKDKLLSDKNRKIDELAESRAHADPWKSEVDDAMKEIDEVFNELARLAFRAASLAEKIPSLDFEGLDERVETKRQRSVLANKYFDCEQHFLHQAVGRMLVMRDQGLIKLVEAERFQLPQDAIQP